MDDIMIDAIHDAYIYTDTEKLDSIWNSLHDTNLIKFYQAQYSENGENYALDGIKNKTLWLSSPFNFNDPFDCILNFDYTNEVVSVCKGISERLYGVEFTEEFLRYPSIDKKLSELIEQMNGRVSNIMPIPNIYVSCFSEIDNLHSLRMWAHYANNHTGFCAEYDFDTLNQSVPFGCIPVKYTKDFSREIHANSIEASTKNFLKMVFNKSDEWSYEKEWRLAQEIEGVSNDGVNIDFALPKKIYLGCKSCVTLKEELFYICKYNQIELYQMYIQPGTFSLYEKKIEF